MTDTQPPTPAEAGPDEGSRVSRQTSGMRNCVDCDGSVTLAQFHTVACHPELLLCARHQQMAIDFVLAARAESSS